MKLSFENKERMSETPSQNSLVLYKGRPARVLTVADKLEIELGGGGTQRVRLKDVTLLHPGPLRGLHELKPQTGEAESACEILDGMSTTLAELADLIYGDYSPATAWAAWQLVAEGLYFQGRPEEVVARPLADVERERVAREAKAAETEAWQQFVHRVEAGRILPEDAEKLKDVEALALGESASCRLLRKLRRPETPASAHALLLKLGHWDAITNPHPRRLKLPMKAPRIELPALAEEPRLDLTDLPTFAIDDEGNRDPDDALSVEGDRLWVHVADVAALVGPDSGADLEARARGATLYLPERTVPMLPWVVTEELGLGLKEISPALSFGLDLGAGEEGKEVEVVRSWVRAKRMTYAEAEARLREEPFKRLWSLAEAFRERREAQGAAVLTFPEAVVRVVEGEVIIRPLPRFRSRTLVAEAMLMAGEASARFALERGIPFPFATQPPAETPWTASSAQQPSLAEMYAYRKKLQRRQMRSTPAPHVGLGLEVYAQVTSPLRRYLDLVAHQQLRAYLRGEELLGEPEVLERVAAAEAVIGSVRRAERLSNRHWTLVHLLRQSTWRGEGILVERHDRRGTLLIPELGFEAQVHVRGETKLDDVMRLILSGVDLPELEVRFRV